MSSARTQLVAELAPVGPPCFSARDIWVEYLKSAAEETRSNHPGPLVFTPGEPVRFNYSFNFCADCMKSHAFEMARQDRCRPSHLWILKRAIPHEPVRQSEIA
jgi:hypothetical protein